MADQTTLSAADDCARKTLESVEKMSPLATQSLQGPMREVVLAAMGLCFTAGSLYGAQRIADGLTNT